MRRASALSALLVMLSVPAFAAGPSATADATVKVSVEVVRPCSVATTEGQAAVRCGSTLSGAAASNSNAPAPIVSPATSVDPHTTVQF
jgi:hypothetical protein